MNHLYESVSYLRGLAEGLEIEESKKGKVTMAIIHTLDEIVTAINILKDDMEDLDEYVDAIEEDLTDLEDDFYDEDFEDDFCEVICPDCGESLIVDDPLVYDDELGETLINCPVCDAKIDVSEMDCCEPFDPFIIEDETLDEDNIQSEDQILDNKDES